MFNILLDKLPDNYKGYLIRTDYRIGIQIIQCALDEDIEENEKLATQLYLLYGKGCPENLDLAIEGLQWFIMRGEISDKDEVKGKNKSLVLDYDIDNTIIMSAFKKAYDIDLHKVKMHWWEFTALMQDLGECTLTNIIDIRRKDISKMTGERRLEYIKLKKKYMIIKKSKEEKERVNEFIKAFKQGK